jgi:hypothetical protein
MRRWSRLLIAGLAIVVAGCASTTAPGTATSSARVGGRWVGRLQTSSVSAPVELALTQRGDQIGGTAETTIRGEPLRGIVDARLTGAALQGSILGSSRTANLNLTLEGEVLKGAIGGTPTELRRRSYLAGSVYRSSETTSLQAP